jgi:hypothetical protein
VGKPTKHRSRWRIRWFDQDGHRLVAYAETVFDRFSFVCETALLDRFITEPRNSQRA